LASVNTEEKTTRPGQKLRYYCYIGLQSKRWNWFPINKNLLLRQWKSFY